MSDVADEEYGIRLKLASLDTSDGIQGIMFEDDRNHYVLKLLRSGRPVVVTAKIGAFRNLSSLTVQRVVPAGYLMPLGVIAGPGDGVVCE